MTSREGRCGMAILLNYPWVNAFVKYFDYDKLFLLACSVCLLLENFTKKLEKEKPQKATFTSCLKFP